jgi:hypothetical protein
LPAWEHPPIRKTRLAAAWLSQRGAHPDLSLIAAARPAVATLAASEVWWIASTPLRRCTPCSALRAPDVAAQLRSDPDPLVRAFANADS